MKRIYSNAFLLPGLLVFIIFFFIPSIGSFYYSFGRWSGVNFAGFCGFDNYISVITDSNLNISFKNTAIFAVVTMFFKMSLGLALALIANMQLKTKEFFKSIIFFPVILSSVAVGVAFSGMMHPEVGIINVFLRKIGLGIFARGWLTEPNIIMLSLSVIEIWKWVGLNMAIFLAALQTIPIELYEAVSIDGAPALRKFTAITMPMLRPVINTNIVLAVIGGLTSFDIIYATTGGGPGTMSEVINTLVLRRFADGLYGLSTAANVILFIGVAIIAVVLQKVLAGSEGEV